MLDGNISRDRAQPGPSNETKAAADERRMTAWIGTSLVIHANADDQMTNPAGNSGARIACGVLRAIP